jgi:hypothetical protein
MTKSLTLYICGVDWQHELGEASDGTRVYPSLEAIQHHRTCVKQCGVVRVTAVVQEAEWVMPQNFRKRKEEGK